MILNNRSSLRPQVICRRLSICYVVVTSAVLLWPGILPLQLRQQNFRSLLFSICPEWFFAVPFHQAVAALLHMRADERCLHTPYRESEGPVYNVARRVPCG